MRPDTAMTLRAALASRASDGSRFLHGPDRSIPFATLARASDRIDQVGLHGRTVVVDVQEQFDAAQVLIALDGIAARIVVFPPDLPEIHRSAIIAKSKADVVITEPLLPLAAQHNPVEGEAEIAPLETEWLLLTSGTTGTPKIVSHTLRGLTGAIDRTVAPSVPPVWATFYDIRRYGGMQIFLRAVLGTGSLVLPRRGEALSDTLKHYGAHGVTHISGTPSHWRRVLMNPVVASFCPAYVRLSGEIADQAVLDALKTHFPNAKIGHAYASTEAGVGFEVNDGLAGFPAHHVDATGGLVAMKVVDDTLRIRSSRTATDYVGEDIAVRDADGFVDTGDIVLRRGERFFFAGRRGGIINVGGQKVHPEEVEAVINRHGAVRMSLVKSRRNPITGAVVAAEVVLDAAQVKSDDEVVKREIVEECRRSLPAWQVPASIRFVPSLDMTAAGKLARHA